MSRLPPEPPSAEITPPELYARRREFLKNTALFAGTAAVVGTGLLRLLGWPRGSRPTEAELSTPGPRPLWSPTAPTPTYTLTDPLTPYDDVTTYNNFYELGVQKFEPSERAGTLKPRPWTVAIEGEVKKPGRFDLDTLLGWFALEERVYRMRCVEA